MVQYKVTHRTYGAGIVVETSGGYATVNFGGVEKKFVIKGFDKFFEIEDVELQKIVDKANDETVTELKAAPATLSVKPGVSPTKAYYTSLCEVGIANALLGPRSQTIPVSSESQMFEIVGYMARPGRISSVEAEVPIDGRDDLFEKLFPGQTYRPITIGYTPSGIPNKLSPQFRINFANIRNCPQILKANMGAGNASCVGRINKSRFVLTLVQNYGFRFGDRQNTNEIRRISAEKGYLEDFERGFTL